MSALEAADIFLSSRNIGVLPISARISGLCIYFIVSYQRTASAPIFPCSSNTSYGRSSRLQAAASKLSAAEVRHLVSCWTIELMISSFALLARRTESSALCGSRSVLSTCTSGREEGSRPKSCQQARTFFSAAHAH